MSFKTLLKDNGQGRTFTPFAAYTVNEDGSKNWIEGEIDIDFIDINFSSILPAQVPTIAKEKLDELKTKVDTAHEGDEGLKLFFDYLHAQGII